MIETYKKSSVARGIFVLIRLVGYDNICKSNLPWSEAEYARILLLLYGNPPFATLLRRSRSPKKEQEHYGAPAFIRESALRYATAAESNLIVSTLIKSYVFKISNNSSDCIV